MTTVLKDLFTSKKFLAALSAVLIYLAGRFGFELDPAALDRIFAALLVYVGAQGAADIGKSAAAINAVASDPGRSIEASKAMQRVASTVPMLAVLLLGAGLVASQVSCAGTARPRATAGATVAIDCTAPDIAAIVGDVGHALVGYVLKYISGDGRHVDTTKLVADLKVLKGDLLGSCGVTTALAILATPKPPGPPSFYAEPSGPDPAEWAVALAAVRAELGVGAVKGG